VPTDEWERGYSAGYRAAHRTDVRDITSERGDSRPRASKSSPKKRKPSAYSKRYGAAFRKVASRFKKKNGSWKTNGFKNAQKAAHKLAKRK
jgi:hypothetical protein